MARDQTKPESYRVAARHGFAVDREREEIIFGETIDWSENSGGTASFDDSSYAGRDGITLGTLKELREKNYIGGEQRQNASPTVDEFIEHGETMVEDFGIDPDDVRFIGYVVSPYRDDARISIEGMYVKSTGDSTFGKLDHYFGRHFGHPNDDHYQWLDGERNLRGEVSVWHD